MLNKVSVFYLKISPIPQFFTAFAWLLPELLSNWPFSVSWVVVLKEELSTSFITVLFKGFQKVLGLFQAPLVMLPTGFEIHFFPLWTFEAKTIWLKLWLSLFFLDVKFAFVTNNELKNGGKKALQSDFFVKRSGSLWERAFMLTELVLQPLLLLSAGYQRAARHLTEGAGRRRRKQRMVEEGCTKGNYSFPL